MSRKKSLINNDLGGNQIIYSGEEEENKDTIETYNVSANNIDIDKLIKKVYDEFNASEERKLMLAGIDYYKNNSEIDSKIRFDHSRGCCKEE